MELGLLYFFAIGGLGVIGLMMAGWSSFNKYSLLGGLRAAAAIISYELPLILGVMGIVLLAGTLNLGTIVDNQSGCILDWYAFQQPLALIIFFIAATAEASRTPFDFTEADSEIVAGFATEYSGMRFGFFFFAEYVNVFILSALTVTLFLGGWNGLFDIDPLLDALGIATPVSLGPRHRLAGSLAAGHPPARAAHPGPRPGRPAVDAQVLVGRPEVPGRRLPAGQPAGHGRGQHLGALQLRGAHGHHLVPAQVVRCWWRSSCSCAPPSRACAWTSSWASPGSG